MSRLSLPEAYARLDAFDQEMANTKRALRDVRREQREIRSALPEPAPQTVTVDRPSPWALRSDVLQVLDGLSGFPATLHLDVPQLITILADVVGYLEHSATVIEGVIDLRSSLRSLLEDDSLVHPPAPEYFGEADEGAIVRDLDHPSCQVATDPVYRPDDLAALDED